MEGNLIPIPEATHLGGIRKPPDQPSVAAAEADESSESVTPTWRGWKTSTTPDTRSAAQQGTAWHSGVSMGATG